jgi:hypothetical protein
MSQRAKHLADTTTVLSSNFEFSRHFYLDTMSAALRQNAVTEFRYLSDKIKAVWTEFVWSC